jgi:hypothetical protein
VGGESVAVAVGSGCIYPGATVRSVTRPGLVLAIAVVVFALPTIASGALSVPAAPASNSVTYQDSTGEDPEGPDITTITVSNDDTGMITFRINVPNRPTLEQDMLFEIWVDSDDNAATGDPELAGVDYVMQLVRGEINLFKWDGTDFTRRFGDPPAVTLSQSYQAGLTVKISASELGNTKKFKFFVIVLSGLLVDPVTGEIDGANAHGDAAPGGGTGLYPYEVKITPPTLVVKKVTRSPAKPKAGKPFTLRLVAARSDTGAVIQNGRVTCVGKVANKRVKPQVARVVRGAATCTWNIPSSAARKTLRGTVTVAFEGLKASQSYTSKIRR